MQMLKKLFNSDNKFYLQLDEIKESAVETASKAADAVKEKASDIADSQPVQKAVTTAKDIVSDEDAEAKSGKTKDKPEVAKQDLEVKDKPEAKTKQQQVKDKPEAKTEQNKVEPAAKSQQNGKADTSKDTTPSLENSGASSFDPPFWVAAMYNNNDSDRNSEAETAQQTFATDNLMPIGTKFRRRPGGSLDKFKEMAKQAKTPKR